MITILSVVALAVLVHEIIQPNQIVERHEDLSNHEIIASISTETNGVGNE